MKKLNSELKDLCKNNRDGSSGTQRDRFKSLQLIASQLDQLGYRQMGVQSLKPMYVTALLAHWQSLDLSTGTLKNRLSHLRWWARKIGRHNVMAKNDDFYGIEQRQFVAHQSKARELGHEQLYSISRVCVSEI